MLTININIVRVRYLVVVRLLLEAKANPNERFHTTALLHGAAGNGHANVLRLLLDANAEVDLRNTQNKTALQIGAYWNKLEACRVLLEASADVNVVDSTEPTLGVPAASLMLLALQRDAASCEDGSLHELFIRHGANPSYTNESGIGALLLASFIGRPNIVRVLLEAKANIHQKMGSN